MHAGTSVCWRSGPGNKWRAEKLDHTCSGSQPKRAVTIAEGAEEPRRGKLPLAPDGAEASVGKAHEQAHLSGGNPEQAMIVTGRRVEADGRRDGWIERKIPDPFFALEPVGPKSSHQPKGPGFSFAPKRERAVSLARDKVGNDLPLLEVEQGINFILR